MPFRLPLQVPWLLCLLLACTQTGCIPEAGTDEDSVALRQKHQRGTLAREGSWSPTAELEQIHGNHTATLLPDGRVLVAGGKIHFENRYSFISELYDPATGTWSSARSLNQVRSIAAAVLLPSGKVLVVGGSMGPGPGILLASAELYDPASGTWSSTGSLAQARSLPTATLLPDGRVLVVGGSTALESYSASAELYDPASGTWSSTGSLAQGRTSHTATLLPDGKVLVVGGRSAAQYLTSAEVYDPASRTWSSTGSLAQERHGHTATLLPDGKVLAVGGVGSKKHLASAELYDPVRGTWSPTSSLLQDRISHTATLLPDGKVLVAGGTGGSPSTHLASAELYDPASGTWSSTSPLSVPKTAHSATLLPDGRVLAISSTAASAELYDPVDPSQRWSSLSLQTRALPDSTATLLPDGKVLMVGGVVPRSTGPIIPSASVGMWDPTDGSWIPKAPLAQARFGHTATLLPNGRVLVTGGRTEGDIHLDSAELYDPVEDRWSPAGTLAQNRYVHTATLLSTGEVLVVGGMSQPSRYTLDFVASAERYDPVQNTWSTTSPLSQPRGYHTATLLKDGRVFVVAGADKVGAVNSAELYDPITHTWQRSAGRLKHRRSRHTTTLLPSGQVLVAGGRGDGGALTSAGVLSSAEVYEPTTDSWSSTGSMIHARASHSATLLLTGQILVMGGSAPRLSSAELYEPATGAWHSAGAISHARGSHTATLLPEGQVFVVGGGDEQALAFAEVYSPAAGSPSRRPQCTEISPSIAEPGDTLLVQGQRFRSSLEGSSGGRQSSPAVFPILTLRSISGDQWIRLAGRSFSETSVTVDLPSLPGGYYWLHVTTQALTSSKRIFVSNRTPPETALTASPSEQTQATQASFAFSSGAVDLLTFECSLDRAGFSSCASPITYDSLSPGPHTFQVRARDIAGNVDANPATASWLVDTEAPQSTLSPQVNALTNALQASFQFSSAGSDVASFECSLDRADFSPCASPITYDSLSPGLHSFQVRARDRAGNVEPSPAAYTWTVDTEAPDADFAQGSIPPVTHTRASFAFSSSAKDLFSFECTLDDAPFTACLSPVTYDSLSPGAHTVRVRARDTAGNVTLEPTAHSWEVDTTPPAPPSIRAPAQGQQLLTPQPVFSGTAESGSTVTIFLNGAEAGTVRVEEDGVWSLPAPAPLGFGAHRVRAIATDPVGNLSEATAEVSFSLPRRGYYGLGCAAGSPAWVSPWALLLLGLLRRRSRQDVAAAPRLESSLPGPGPGQTRLPPRGGMPC